MVDATDAPCTIRIVGKADNQRVKTAQPCAVCGKPYRPFRNKRLTSTCCSRRCGAIYTGREKARRYRAAYEPPPLTPTGARWIPLHTGRHVLVDAADYARAAPFAWTDDGRCGQHVFIIDGRRTLTRLHHFILDIPARSGITVDHRDGDPLNCRRTNLRRATRTESVRNRSKQHRHGPPASIYKGVSKKRGRHAKPWWAMIRVGGRRRHLGHFTNEHDAAVAYDGAARIYFGAFAALNFPRPGDRSALAPEPLLTPRRGPPLPKQRAAHVIYRCVCAATGLCYVGRTSNLKSRWRGHIYNATRRQEPGALHDAIRKYGAHTFTVYILEEVADKDAAIRAEQRWIKQLNCVAPNGLNRNCGPYRKRDVP